MKFETLTAAMITGKPMSCIGTSKDGPSSWGTEATIDNRTMQNPT